MSNILDQLFRLTPVESEPGTSAEQDTTIIDNIDAPMVESEPQSDVSGALVAEESQGKSPEDTATDDRAGELVEHIERLEKLVSEMQAQQAKHSHALEKFVRYSPLPAEVGKQQPGDNATLAPDVPPAFEPLHEMDFSRDGKF